MKRILFGLGVFTLASHVLVQARSKYLLIEIDDGTAGAMYGMGFRSSLSSSIHSICKTEWKSCTSDDECCRDLYCVDCNCEQYRTCSRKKGGVDINPRRGEVVWEKRDRYTRRIYVMYHATKPEYAQSIFKEGFSLKNAGENDPGMLGRGVYVTRDITKTYVYGPVTLKLLVYTGKTIRIDYQGHPRQRNWQKDFDSAWVPPNNKMVKSGREENCVRSPKQIKVIGVARGMHLLNSEAKRYIRSLDFKKELKDLVEEQGFVYSE